MSWYIAALWGATGAGATVAVEIVQAAQRLGAVEGRAERKAAFSPYSDPAYYLANFTRVILGAGAAAMLKLALPDSSPPIALFTVGAAAPALLRSLTRVRTIGEAVFLDSVVPLPTQISQADDAIRPQITQLRQEIDEIKRISTNDERIGQLEVEILQLSEKIQRELVAQGKQEQQQNLLISMYNQGLTAARASFRMSVAAEVVGASIIFTGILMALFKDSAQGKSYASIVTMISGVITNLLGGVFLAQTSQARKHLASLATMLREDLQISWRVAKAISIADDVSTSEKRDAIYESLAMQSLVIQPTSLNSQSDIGEQSGEK